MSAYLLGIARRRTGLSRIGIWLSPSFRYAENDDVVKSLTIARHNFPYHQDTMESDACGR